MKAAAASRTGPWSDAMVQRGHDVSILTSREGKVSGENLRIVNSRFPTPSNRAGLGRRFLQEIRLGRDLSRLLEGLSPKVDLAIITSPPFFMASLCARASKRAGIPYVFDVRDRYPAVLFDLGVVASEGIIGRTLSRIETRNYAGARLLTTVTSGLTKDLEKSVGSVKVAKVINGFDGRHFTEENLSRPKRQSFTIAYHGRLGRFYEVDALRRIILEVEKLDGEVRFVLAGELEEARSSGDWGATEFIEELPLSMLAEFLSECHLGICLLKETEAMTKALPAKVFDFLGAGLPVLTSPMGELSAFLLKRGVGLTFERTDPLAIASAIVAFKNDPGRQERMATNVRTLRPSLDRRFQSVRFAEHLESLE